MQRTLLVETPTRFSRQEYEARLSKARTALQTVGLDALLIFAPESHYWICGYDTFGLAMFQCMVWPAAGSVDRHLS